MYMYMIVYKKLKNINTIYSLDLHAHIEKHVC